TNWRFRAILAGSIAFRPLLHAYRQIDLDRAWTRSSGALYDRHRHVVESRAPAEDAAHENRRSSECQGRRFLVVIESRRAEGKDAPSEIILDVIVIRSEFSVWRILRVLR